MFKWLEYVIGNNLSSWFKEHTDIYLIMALLKSKAAAVEQGAAIPINAIGAVVGNPYVADVTFHGIGACANVFWGRQNRLIGLLGEYIFGEWFSEMNAWTTLAQIGMFAAPPALFEIIRHAVYWQTTRGFGHKIETEANAYKAFCNFQSMSGRLMRFITDLLDSCGHGLKNINMYPLPETLLNVYSGDLREDGAIEATWAFVIYLGLSSASFTAYFSQRYHELNGIMDQKAMELFESINAVIKVEDIEQGNSGSSGDRDVKRFIDAWKKIVDEHRALSGDQDIKITASDVRRVFNEVEVKMNSWTHDGIQPT